MEFTSREQLFNHMRRFSDDFSRLQISTWHETEEDCREAAQKALLFFKNAGHDGSALFYPRNYYYGRDNNYYFELFDSPRSSKAVQFLIDSGVDIWLGYPDSAAMEKDIRENGKASMAYQPIAPSTLANLLACKPPFANVTLQNRKLAAKAIALTATPEQASKLLDHLGRALSESFARSSLTSVGVLGQADKENATHAAVFAEFADLLAASGKISPERPGLRKLLDECKILMDKAKNKSKAAFSPEKTKKAATPEELGRIRAIGYLLENHPSDLRLIKFAFADSEFLRQKPEMMAIPLNKDIPLYFKALQRLRCDPSNELFELVASFNCNIWLCANQMRNSNAVALFGPYLCRDCTDERLNTFCSELIKGAYLDNPENPKQTVADNAQKAFEASGNAAEKQFYQSVKARADAILLQDVLDKMLPSREASLQGAEPKAKGPKRM